MFDFLGVISALWIFHNDDQWYTLPKTNMAPENQWDFQGSPIMGPLYGKFPILFPYHSHKNP